MKLKEYVPIFDEIVKNKDELKLYEVGFKIARLYAYRYASTNPGFDYEDVAQETILQLLKVVKKTDWNKPSEYYWGVIRKEIYYHFCKFYKDKTLSLDSCTTDTDGDNYEDKFELKEIEWNRETREQIESDFINECIELADEFKTKDEVFEIMKKKYPELERAYYLRLIRQYDVQFDMGRTRNFIEYTKVYNIYKILDEDRNKTRNFLKENNINIDVSVKVAVSLAEEWLELFKTNKKKFMNIFVNPPNMSGVWDKLGV